MATSYPERSELGELGEALVADWLQGQGWQILERQWHCRWGELDLVAVRADGETRGNRVPDFQVRPTLPLLAFVEVKTRSQGNWDADGLMAINTRKQKNLWQAARLYLVRNPHWAEALCRFDVALVVCRPSSRAAGLTQQPFPKGQALVLQDYIENAFDGF